MLRSKIHIKRKGALFAVLFTSIFALIGLTIAFNSDLKIFGNLFKAGAYEAEYREEFTSPTDWTPCTETPKLVTVKNNSPVNVKVRLKYDEFWRNKADTQDLPLIKDGTTLAVINFQNEDDWEQHGEWYYYKEDLAPEAVTSSLFKSVTLDCNANLAVEKVCHETPNGAVCEEPDDDDAYDKYHLAVTVQTSDEDFPREDEHYTVTIDPNGGTYNGSTEVYSESLNYGTVIDLSSAVYVGHDLEYWTLNGTDTYTESSIMVEDNISLKANWVSSTWYNVTVDPNGGDFEGHTSAYSTPVRDGGSFTLSSTEPTRDDYLFDGWTINGTPLSDFTFTVNSDVTVKANWALITAQNNNTQQLFSSLTRAEAAATNGDTITLLRDTEENFINTKNITLNLGANTINGSITNNGTLTLLNGEVNNDAGTAFTNNGSLTMGINDHIDINTANIENTYVRLIGTDTGLKQNGEFNFYDGYIEGDVALVGGYDDSPFYRKAMDDEIVYYFPFVDKSPDDNTKQRIILESSDLAVSKTKVGGDIYYYSLQDNINTSIRTGYKIYIAREDWNTGEPITVPENTDVTIDLEGHTFTATDAITINGKLTIEDSHSVIHPETGEVEYAGNILTPQTTINNGELVMKNSRMTGTTVNDTIIDRGILTMQSGRLAATSGYVMRPIQGVAYNLDDNSYLYSFSSKAAVYSDISDFIWEKGNIYGASVGLETTYRSKATLLGGKIKSKSTGVQMASGGSKLTIDGGWIEVERSDAGTMKGVYMGSTWDNNTLLTIKSGGIKITNTTSGNYSVVGVDAVKTEMTGGSIEINVNSNSSNSYYVVKGIDCLLPSVNISNATIAISNSGTANTAGIDTEAPINFSNSTINVTAAATSKAAGIFVDSRSGSSASISNSSITVSNTTNAYGLYSYQTANVTNSTIIASSSQSTGTGIHQQSNRATIQGGKVQGSTYGINAPGYATLGSNDGEVSIEAPEIIGGSYALYGNSFYFYDGVLRSNGKAYQEGVIGAIPDGTTYHTETSENYLENCWLIEADEYLMVNGVRYNSLQKAYDAITGESGTVKVVESVTVEATLPRSPSDKNITFDLNDHQITFTQPLINGGTMTIVDNGTNKTGKLFNLKGDTRAVVNYGTLTFESGYISSTAAAISNEVSSTFIMNGGTIESATSGLYNQRATITVNNGTISGDNYGIYENGTNTTSILGGKIKSKSTGVQMASGGSKLTIDGGWIEVERSDAGTMKGVYMGSTWDNNTLLTIKSGGIKITNTTSGNYSVVGVDAVKTEMTGGSIEINVNSNSSNSYYVVKGIDCLLPSVNISNATIAISNSGTANTAGIDTEAPINFSNSTINVTAAATSKAAGIFVDSRSGSSASISNSSITVSNTTNAYGLYSYQTANVTNSTIIASSSQSTGTGIHQQSNRATIQGGKVQGSTYGINAPGYATLGSNDGEVSIEAPEIIGGSYALYGNSFYFYDGVLRSGVKAYADGIIKEIPEKTTIYIGHQTIDGINYEIRYLIDEYDVAIIGSTKYKQLSSAITAAETNDTIELLATNYVFSAITIPAEKEFTIITNGHQILLGSPITNNGKVTINNNATTTTPDIEYYNSDYAITNEEGAELSMQNIKMPCNYGIDNRGALSLANISITASGTAIKNAGDISAENDIILTGNNYPIYSNGGQSTISDATLTGNAIYNNSGDLTLANSSSSKTNTDKTVYVYVTNNGTLRLQSTLLSLTDTDASYSTTSDRHTVYNSGSLLIGQQSSISYSVNSPDKYLQSTASGIYNDNGTIFASDSSIQIDVTNVSRNISHDIYGIYSPTGAVTIESGSITATNRGRVYALYTNTGTIILGSPEPSDSPNYGRDTADVSTTSPDISAISTSTSGSYKTGIGVKNASGGRVEYYDGKVSGNTSAFAEEPTVTEHFYEVCTELDTTTTPNLYTAKLFWMRDGQSTCANN